MAEREREPRDMETGERMESIGKAKASAIKHKVQGEAQTDHGSRYTVDREAAEQLIENWPAAPRKGAEQMMEQYGTPNEATPTKLMWYGNGPWKKTLVTSDEIVHDFPTPHTDFITQYIDYRVPPDKFNEVGQFDGSCLVDRTAGEAAARCDSEAMNILTLNLMHDIVTGDSTVDEARKKFAENASAHTMGRSAPYTERLQFELPREATNDTDEPMLAGAMAHQTVEKGKDVLGR